MELKNSWIFPVVQSIHLGGIALLVGSIAVGDLRTLGYALRARSDLEVRRRYSAWLNSGLAVILTTGPLLFISDVPRYVHNPAFLVKMALLALALLFHFVVRHRAERHERTAAIVSIALWAAVVLAGRAIADFDI